MTQEFNVTDLEDVFSSIKDNAETHHEHYIIIAVDHAYFEKRRSFRMNRETFSDFEQKVS